MDNSYDIVIIGAATSGSYFAKRMADEGFKVLVLDRDREENVGSRLTVFHMDRELFPEFGVPEPAEGDEDFLTVFREGYSLSALNRYRKTTRYPFVVMNLPLFIKRLVKRARDAGAEYSHETEFLDFVLEDGKISGVRVRKDGKETEISARLVADCSGIDAAARTRLPDGYGVENFSLSPRDRFYVVLRYVRLLRPEEDRITSNTSWPYYKSWIAPSPDPDGAIIGVGANHSFEYAEKCFAAFARDIPIPAHEVVRVERGSTPYRRPPYSFVSDGFIALGDAACITKPFSGEGVTASWKLTSIACGVIPRVLREGKATADAMWAINVLYNRGQGADFANVLASLVGAANCTREENDYEFEKSMIFSDEALTKVNRSFANRMSAGELLDIGLKGLGGILTGKLKLGTIKEVVKYSALAGRLERLYRRYPSDRKGLAEWVAKVDPIWNRVGSMADKCVL